MEPLSRKQPKEKDETEAKKVRIGCVILDRFYTRLVAKVHRQHWCHVTDTQPLLAVAARNDEA